MRWSGRTKESSMRKTVLFVSATIMGAGILPWMQMRKVPADIYTVDTGYKE